MRFGCAGSWKSSVLRSPNAISLRRVARNVGPGTVLDRGALSLWCRAHFWTRSSHFVAGAMETFVFWWSKSTFRDRCRRSEHDFGVGAVHWTLWSSAFSDFVAGAVNRDFWTRGSFFSKSE